MARNQVTKNAVQGDPMDTSLAGVGAVENMTVSKPIATQEPNTARKYIDGVSKIKNIVTAKAAKGDPMLPIDAKQPMNSAAKSDMDESIEITDSIKNLFEGSELSDEFKEKLVIIFEAAVKEKTFELMTNLEEHYNEALQEEIESLAEVMIEAIDTKLDYVSGIWLEENEIAIENGIKLELFENFIGGMKTLFQENYVDIPEEKFDVLSGMSDVMTELEDKLNEQIEINCQLNNQLQESVVNRTINTVGKDLSENQKEKLRFLSEGMSFDSDRQLVNKIQILKESNFPVTTKNYTILEEDVSGEYTNLSDSMAKYVNAL